MFYNRPWAQTSPLGCFELMYKLTPIPTHNIYGLFFYLLLLFPQFYWIIIKSHFDADWCRYWLIISSKKYHWSCPGVCYKYSGGSCNSNRGLCLLAFWKKPCSSCMDLFSLVRTWDCRWFQALMILLVEVSAFCYHFLFLLLVEALFFFCYVLELVKGFWAFHSVIGILTVSGYGSMHRLLL